MLIKRKAKRVDIECAITIKDTFPVNPPSDNLAKCLDVSPLGIKLCYSQDIAVDTIVNMIMKVPECGFTPEIIGQIKWKKETDDGLYYYGIEFLEDNQDLAKFLKIVTS